MSKHVFFVFSNQHYCFIYLNYEDVPSFHYNLLIQWFFRRLKEVLSFSNYCHNIRWAKTRKYTDICHCLNLARQTRCYIVYNSLQTTSNHENIGNSFSINVTSYCQCSCIFIRESRTYISTEPLRVFYDYNAKWKDLTDKRIWIFQQTVLPQSRVRCKSTLSTIYCHFIFSF